jgi:hypothetical protein
MCNNLNRKTLYTGNLGKVQTEGKYKGKSKEVAL